MKRLFLALLLCGFMFGASFHLLAQDASGGASTPAAHSPQVEKQEKSEDDAYRHSAAVKAFGSMLGLDVDQAASIFEFANFAILLGLVGWFLVKTLPKTFRDRTSAIQKDLVIARAATEEANARMNSVEARLAKLDGDIAAMRTQAEKDSAADEARLRAAVEDEKAKILASAEQEISAATIHAHRQLQQFAAELAIEQAAKKLVITAETDRLLVRDFARRLGSDEPKGGQN